MVSNALDALHAPASPTAPIDHYHSLLDDASLGAESQQVLVDMLSRDGLFFGERPLCGVLRPRFLTLAQYTHIANACRLVGQAFEKVRVAAMADSALREQFSPVRVGRAFGARRSWIRNGQPHQPP